MDPIATFPTAWVITLKNSPPHPDGLAPCQGGTQAERWKAEEEHLQAVSVPYKPFCGIDGRVSGLTTAHTFEVNNPGTGEKIGIPTVSLYLSHYMLWKVLEHQEGDYFLILEDDCRFDADWRPRFDAAWAILPDDWDFLFVGACGNNPVAGGMVGKHTNLYHHGAMCLHCYMVRKKVIPVLLEKMMPVTGPIDIELVYRAWKHISVYAIIPRLATQWGIA